MTPISVENVWKFFGDYPALREVSFKLESSSCLALLGRNGAGKTTMLRILAGLSSASKGAVNLPDRRRTSYLGHNIGIYDELSAYENLKLFARFYEMANPASVASKTSKADLAAAIGAEKGVQSPREGVSWDYPGRGCRGTPPRGVVIRPSERSLRGRFPG